MSKAFGMAGLRIGWIASHDKNILKEIEKIKHYTSICCSGPAEIISVIVLNNKEYFLARNNIIVSANLALIDKFMTDHHNLFQWVRPEGGCVGFVNYKGIGSVDEFCQSLIAKTGVLLMPASIYDSNTEHFRIGFGRKNMPEALQRLRRYLEE